MYWRRLLYNMGYLCVTIYTYCNTVDNPAKPVSRDASRYAFIDVEVGMKDHLIHDIGALRWHHKTFDPEQLSPTIDKSELYPFRKKISEKLFGQHKQMGIARDMIL